MTANAWAARPFESVYLLSHKLDPRPLSQTLELEEMLHLQLPPLYHAYESTLGVGLYCGFLRIYPPDQVVAEVEEWRAFPYDFWPAGRDILSLEQIRASVPLGDTWAGDLLIFSPVQPTTLFVLPRNDEDIYWIPEPYRNLTDWRCRSGIARSATPVPFFYGYRDRLQYLFLTEPTDTPLEEVAAQVMQQWGQPFKQTTPHHVDDAQALYFFVPSIGGLVEFLQEDGETFIGVIINADLEYADHVEELCRILSAWGFDTGRNL